MTDQRRAGRPPARCPQVRRTLREAGLRARHNLSQNFLADVDVLEGILREADPSPARGVLEIGPGLGFLTGGLLAAGARVTAVELDRGLVAHPRRAVHGKSSSAARCASSRAMHSTRTSSTSCRHRTTSSRTCPYHITSPILHRLLGGPPRAGRLVLMVQREVAERIAAAPGDMSYLSVFVPVPRHGPASRSGCPREAFEPAPKVESAVLVLEPYPADDRLDPEAEDHLWRVVQAGFRERRKMIHNVLARQLPVPPERVEAALDGRRDRPRPAARRPSPWGSGSPSPRRSVPSRRPMSDATGGPIPPAASRRSCGWPRPRST